MLKLKKNMKQQDFNKILGDYRILDLEMKIAKRKCQILKDQIKAHLKDNDLDSYEFDEVKATRFSVDKTMYVKEKLIAKFGEAKLEDCTKTISYDSLKISYENN